eukprot:926237-Prorocentrum_minimum.AAC.1
MSKVHYDDPMYPTSSHLKLKGALQRLNRKELSMITKGLNAVVSPTSVHSVAVVSPTSVHSVLSIMCGDKKGCSLQHRLASDIQGVVVFERPGCCHHPPSPLSSSSPIAEKRAAPQPPPRQPRQSTLGADLAGAAGADKRFSFFRKR